MTDGGTLVVCTSASEVADHLYRHWARTPPGYGYLGVPNINVKSIHTNGWALITVDGLTGAAAALVALDAISQPEKNNLLVFLTEVESFLKDKLSDSSIERLRISSIYGDAVKEYDLEESR